MEAVATRTTQVLEDVNVMVGGQGGDGTLTVVALLGRVFRSMGLNVYDSRNVLSRIRGGHADGIIRASTRKIFNIGDKLQILVAFDEEAIKVAGDDLADDAVILYDSSSGDLSKELVKERMTIYNIPFGIMATTSVRRELFKNTIAYAIVGRLLSLSDEALAEAIKSRYAKKNPLIVESNLRALEVGLKHADQKVAPKNKGKYALKKGNSFGKLLINGNEATGYGFLVSGGRFFAGYPITPATEIMEWLESQLPKFNGVVKQAEDELSAVNMAIGAAFAGARAMVATSGPGLSLMAEGIGQAGGAEIPLVIVDSQRSGPSTGMPTKVEQSDIYLMCFGGHGDFPKIVLAPGSADDCFYMTNMACNLAERYQLPVFLALDLALSHNAATIEPFDFNKLRIDRGKRLTQEELYRMERYKRYTFVDDGVSPLTVPSMDGGMALVTGNEHDEWGHVATEKVNRTKMMQKRMKKLETVTPELPLPYYFGENTAKIGLIGFGSTYGPILEAMDQLGGKGIPTKFMQIRTIWPLQKEVVSYFVDSCDTVCVVEHNFQGQLANVIKMVCSGRWKTKGGQKIINVLKYDGGMFKPHEIANEILKTTWK